MLLNSLDKYTHIENDLIYSFWALPRPMTKGWGSGKVFERLNNSFGEIDVAFSKTDGIPKNILAVDKRNGYDWKCLPFPDNGFYFGYWDPLYDRLYKQEALEIWRTCWYLAILHTHIYPTSWFKDAKRIGGIAITMGPLKKIRCLQIFKKTTCS